MSEVAKKKTAEAVKIDQSIFEVDAGLGNSEVNSEVLSIPFLKTNLSNTIQEENRGWGYKKTPDELVDRIINPLRDRLKGKVACGDDDGIGERLSQLLYEEEEN